VDSCPEALYWRTATGMEVDFVIETPNRLLPIEVKASSRVTTADAKGLEAFLEEGNGVKSPLDSFNQVR
jgi:uncharacterized protein